MSANTSSSVRPATLAAQRLALAGGRHVGRAAHRHDLVGSLHHPRVGQLAVERDEPVREARERLAHRPAEGGALDRDDAAQADLGGDARDRGGVLRPAVQRPFVAEALVAGGGRGAAGRGAAELGVDDDQVRRAVGCDERRRRSAAERARPGLVG